MGITPFDNMYATAVKDDITQPLQSLQQAPPAAVPHAQAVGDNAREASPAYECVEHLLTTRYRLRSADDINAVMPNATRGGNLLRCWQRLFGVRCFEVNHGNLLLAEDGSGNYEIFAPGVHRVHNFFMRIQEDVSVSQEVISHGDRTIVTVKQGHI